MALVPLEELTVTSTVPAGSDGEMALSEVAEATVKLVAATVPKLTELAPTKPVPVTVTVVPRPAGPAPG